jgi:hypothetical protein
MAKPQQESGQSGAEFNLEELSQLIIGTVTQQIGFVMLANDMNQITILKNIYATHYERLSHAYKLAGQEIPDDLRNKMIEGYPGAIKQKEAYVKQQLTAFQHQQKK